jgi:hypothetical protein
VGTDHLSFKLKGLFQGEWHHEIIDLSPLGERFFYLSTPTEPERVIVFCSYTKIKEQSKEGWHHERLFVP